MDYTELFQPPTYPTLLHLLFWWIWGMLVIGVCIRTDAPTPTPKNAIRVREKGKGENGKRVKGKSEKFLSVVFLSLFPDIFATCCTKP